MAAGEIVKKIIELEERITGLRREFDGCPEKEKESVLTTIFKGHLDSISEDEPVSLSLVRVVEMLVCTESDIGIQLLGQGLSHPNPDIRLLSGDALIHLAEEGIEQIQTAVEEALEKGGPGAVEMVFMLAHMDDLEVLPVLERFLAHPEADVCAATIEALAEMGLPESISVIEKFKDDKRMVSIEGDSDTEETCTVGQLATDAIELLCNEEEED